MCNLMSFSKGNGHTYSSDNPNYYEDCSRCLGNITRGNLEICDVEKFLVIPGFIIFDYFTCPWDFWWVSFFFTHLNIFFFFFSFLFWILFWFWQWFTWWTFSLILLILFCIFLFFTFWIIFWLSFLFFRLLFFLFFFFRFWLWFNWFRICSFFLLAWFPIYYGFFVSFIFLSYLFLVPCSQLKSSHITLFNFSFRIDSSRCKINQNIMICWYQESLSKGSLIYCCNFTLRNFIRAHIIKLKPWLHNNTNFFIEPVLFNLYHQISKFLLIIALVIPAGIILIHFLR